jgi:hypothetical protein
MNNLRCAHCNSTVRDCITHYIDDEGSLWRVPTKVCTNEECLSKQGATVQRAAKREHPELQSVPPSHYASDELLFPSIPPTPQQQGSV